MRLMILDGNSVMNRAFYGVHLLSTRSGQFTNAIYGFLNILHRLETDEEPDALCVAFDLKAPTFRHLQYEGYKANRHGMPDELASQMPIMKQILSAMRIPIYECEGWEADDVIGTVSRRCAEGGWDCIIVTGDRDSLQLVDEHTSVNLVVSKGGQTKTTCYDPAVFQEEYGFEPKRLIDLKGLMGDSSDNIPGVAGVGPKTATQLLLQFGTLQGIYDHLADADIKPKLREKLEAGRESAFLSYDLATIRCEAPVSFAPGDAIRQEPDRRALLALFEELEFVKLIDRYGLQNAGAEPAVGQTAALCVQPLPDIPAPGEPVAIYVDAALSNAAFATAAGVICQPLPACQAALAALLDSETPMACHDWKRLCRLLTAHGLPVGKCQFDSALAAYVLNPAEGHYQLSRVAQTYLRQKVDEADLAQCAAAVFALWQMLPQQLTEQGAQTLYETIDLPLCPVLAQMEKTGVAVDRTALTQFGEMLRQGIDGCQSEIFRYAGEPFNINSTKALGEVLFEKLQLPPVKKTKTGYSTNAEVLEKLSQKHPIIQQIMDYRMLTKLKSTYADGLLKVIEADGRIRTTFQNMVTATGRLSSTDPNLQNIPVRTELGSEIRRMFVARPGWTLVDADYSQIELRVLAHIADDDIMRQAFASGNDIHTVTASQVFHVPPEMVTSLMRRHAKAVNFGIVYGISSWSLAADIGVPVSEAEEYINSYLAHYDGVRQYMKQVVEQAKQTGYVSTMFGRRRYLPDLKSRNFNIRSAAERIALNTPIQGTAADIIKMAMLRVSAALEQEALQARLVLQVHDELIVECPACEAELVMQIVTREMEQAAQLSVPLVAEAKMGDSWYDAK